MKFPKQVRVFNNGVIALADSPRWGKLVRRQIAVLTYTGRRSGRVFSTPLSYQRSGDELRIRVALPDAKSWWRNFQGDGAPLSMRLDGVEHAGQGVARRDERGRVTVVVRLDNP
jgi:F420H(2)-dependent quinone reductase